MSSRICYETTRSIKISFFLRSSLNVSKVFSSDLLFERSVYEALKNSLEIKAQIYKLAAAKNS